MKSAHLIRFFTDDRQSLGTLTTQKSNNELWTCKTLELPDKKNQTNISRIPSGEYLCQWTKSSRLSKLAGHDVYTYEVFGVPNRKGIRIHSANYFFQLKGCIALGATHKDINIDGNLDLIHSGTTIREFVAIMEYQDFELVIAD